MPESLEELRDRIRQLDQQMIQLAAERLVLGRAVGDAKRKAQLPTVDYAQERVVLDRARAAAVAMELDPRVAEDLFITLIKATVSAQDLDHRRQAALGLGKQAIVVGGAGRMGQWLLGFLRDQGYRAASLDPGSPEEENHWAQSALPGADLVICSTPPTVTAELYRDWIPNPPRGVIADIASIKTPLLAPISALQQAGARVASFHPMFGPSIRLLRDSDVVICDTGDLAATAVINSLFTPTTAKLIHLPIIEHDRVMAEVLSLAHMTALTFAISLPAKSPGVRSTTLGALETIAHNIVRESADVYYEIQTENPHSAAVLNRLHEGLSRLSETIRNHDPEAFRELLELGKQRT